MTVTVEQIEEAITQLPQEELTQFRAWYEKLGTDQTGSQLHRVPIGPDKDGHRGRPYGNNFRQFTVGAPPVEMSNHCVLVRVYWHPNIAASQ